MPWGVLVRAVITACLLIYLFTQFEPMFDMEKLRAVHTGWWFLACAAFVLSQVAGALRWKKLLECLGALPRPVSYRFSLAATFSALWYSNFLPSAYGGDAVRVAQTWALGGKAVRALAASVLDRCFGLAGLFLAMLICLPVSWVVKGLGMVFSWGLWRAGHGVVSRSRMLPWAMRRVRRVWHLVTAIARVFRHRQQVFQQCVLTVVATLLGFLTYGCCVMAVGVVPDPFALVMAASLSVLAAALPVSLAGWGVREGTLVALLQTLCGLEASQAATVALINASSILGAGLIGAFAQLRLGLLPAAVVSTGGER